YSRLIRGTTLLACMVQLLELGGAVASRGSISGSEKTFQIQGNATIRLKVPSGWQDVKNLMNAPLTLLGPERKGIRPVINFVPTGVSSSSIDEGSFKGDVKAWENGRKKFLKEEGGTLLE